MIFLYSCCHVWLPKSVFTVDVSDNVFEQAIEVSLVQDYVKRNDVTNLNMYCSIYQGENCGTLLAGPHTLITVTMTSTPTLTLTLSRNSGMSIRGFIMCWKQQI